MCSKVVIVGIGNILLGDEGVGVHLVREIAGNPLLPKSVKCIDGGTASYDILYACGECRHIIILDAIKAGGKTGTIYKMDIEEWRRSQRASLHDICLLDAISTAQILRGFQIPVRIIGVDPGDISPGLELSPPVKKRIKELAAYVLAEAAKLAGA
jgi:hydrogenase maturation protease